MSHVREGAHYLGEGRCRFGVWAPQHEAMAVHLLDQERLIPLSADDGGYFSTVVDAVMPGEHYVYRSSSGEAWPDPASLYQPLGIDGPSQVFALDDFTWHDQDWAGVPWDDLVIYQLHVGTFTHQGTLDAVIPQLPYLCTLGVTALQLLPLAQFPGNRNWGYDGVFPYAVHHTYGGPRALQRLVDACHGHGLALFLDVVYNHLGPLGCCLPVYGPYGSARYCGPWGQALNFDGPGADGVRSYFIKNALTWVKDFHVDGLRLDAIHGIYDQSAYPFLAELADQVGELAQANQRQVHVIGESDLNDPRVLAARPGLALDGQWSDDFHHALHTLLTAERQGYYQDFGEIHHLEKALRQGFVYTGQHSTHRLRRHGAALPSELCGRLVVYAQNHDQVGNRPGGERLTRLVTDQQGGLAAAVVLLSPSIPLLFMGEEYGELAPFYYFTDHGEPELGQAVKAGREKELAGWGKGEVPDPEEEDTFLASRLCPPEERQAAANSRRLALYRQLGVWRRYARRAGGHVEVKGCPEDNVITLAQRGGRREFFTIFHFSSHPQQIRLPIGCWVLRLDTTLPEPGGEAAAPVTGRVRVEPWSATLYEKIGGPQLG